MLTVIVETDVLLLRLFYYNARFFSCLKLFQQRVPDILYCKSSVCAQGHDPRETGQNRGTLDITHGM